MWFLGLCKITSSASMVHHEVSRKIHAKWIKTIHICFGWQIKDKMEAAIPVEGQENDCGHGCHTQCACPGFPAYLSVKAFLTAHTKRNIYKPAKPPSEHFCPQYIVTEKYRWIPLPTHPLFFGERIWDSVYWTEISAESFLIWDPHHSLSWS